MSGLHLSSATRALLQAAKADAPGAVGRAKIWTGVSSSVGAAAAGTGALSGAGASPAVASAVGTGSAAAGVVAGSASKLLAMGALLGSTVTVGVAAVVLHMVPADGVFRSAPPPSEVQSEARGGTRGTRDTNAKPPLAPRGSAEDGVSGSESHLASGSAVDEPTERLDPPAAPVTLDPGAPGRGELGAARVASGPSSAPPLGAAAAGAGAHPKAAAPARRHATLQAGDEDPLMREAALVAEARGSLVRGDAEGALAAIRAAGRGGARELEPEELALEARALRALGRTGEAADVDGRLKTRYPDHALSR